ncbi:MAG: nucleotidyltransferase family protein [Pseudomonadota bacterium]
MILAAGRGARLRPITDEMPKPMVEVGGRPLIERHVRRLVSAGITDIVINLGWLGEQIVAHLGGGERFGASIVYSPEYDQLLDSGGGIRRALPLLGGAPFWVINADILIDFDLPATSLHGDLDGELVLVPNPPHRPDGDFAASDGRVSNRGELSYTFSGIARYRPRFFAGQVDERFSIVPLLRASADAAHLGAIVHSGFWADIGTPERLAEVRRRFR